RLDATCGRFEAAWKAGKPPDIDAFLAETTGAERMALLKELIRLDVFYRRQCGDAVGSAEYQTRFPELDRAWLDREIGNHSSGETTLAQPMAPGEGAKPPGASVLPLVPGYEIVRELGRGGMAVVYEARHIQLNRRVALKTIRADKIDEAGYLARFRTEAEAIARFQHPNIVPIYEVGEHDGLHFFSMELCPGGSLEQKPGGLLSPPRQAAGLIETLARAVHAAHSKGVVHRDLKPGNVLLAEDGAPKIADFGLAKRLDAQQGPTISNVILGSAYYMAPEQAKGKSMEAGPAADIYALGAIFYECLTGRPPFMSANLLDTLAQVANEPPVPVRRLQPKTPRDLETICLKCLQKEPDQRYATAADLADDLRRFLDGDVITAKPPSLWRRAVRLAKRRRLALTAAVCVILIAAAFLVAWFWVHKSQSHEQEIQTHQQEIQKAMRESLPGVLQRFDEDLLFSRKGVGDFDAVQQDLQTKAALYEKYLRAKDADPTAREELGDIYVRLGWMEGLEGDKAQAQTLLEKGRSLFADQCSGDAPPASARAKLANACHDLGTIAILQGRPEQARPYYEESIRLNQRLSDDFPRESKYIAAVAGNWCAFGDLLALQKNLAEADAAYAEAYTQVQKCIGADPSADPQGTWAAAILIRKGEVLEAEGKAPDAESAFSAALALFDRRFGPDRSAWSELEDKPPDSPAVPTGIAHRRVNTLWDAVEDRTPENHFQAMVNHFSAWSAAQPADASRKRQLARSLYYLAITGLAAPASPVNGLSAARKAADLYDQLCAPNPSDADLVMEAAQLSCYTAMCLLQRSDDVLSWCDRGLALLDRAAVPNLLNERAAVLRRDLLLTRAFAKAKEEHALEALQDFELVYRCDPATRKWKICTDTYAATMAQARRRLIVDLLRRERYAEAAAEADALAALPHVPGEALYDGACVFGVMAAANSDPAEREKNGKHCVELLRKAFDVGFDKDPIQKATGNLGDPIEHMESDPDLVAVRGRDDYKQLLTELRRKP
ncbi:MAG TPA: serine/threonine-protein kinase, partial [Gemmataceae bacterium]|nr:serine/threonine-protein kinase [Gemmataceae bacterium]